MDDTHRTRSMDTGELRRMARETAEGRVPDVSGLTPQDVLHLLHEFGVYQHEILSQNEELTAARDELETARNRYHRLYEFAPVGYLTLDAGGRVVEANLTGCGLLGAARSRVVGKELARFVGPAHRMALRRFLDELPEDGAARSLEVSLRAGTAEDRTALLEARRDRGPGGRLWVLTALVDLTERKRMEDELLEARVRAEAANRAKSAFLANMSHEIRTPLNGMIGMTELALLQDPSPRVREYLGYAKDSALALLHIISDILDMAKVEAGQLEFTREPFEVKHAVASVVEPLAVAAERKGLKVTWRVADDVPRRVAGDEGRVRQVLTNLVANAVKFTEQGYVEVDVRREEADLPSAPLRTSHSAPRTRVLFSVRDTGIGIPSEEQETIFRPFSQGRRSAHRLYGGTGLGLTISRQLARQMGGDIRVSSQVGKGSVFTFTAEFEPAEDREPAAEAPARRSLRPGRKLRILVAEDDVVNQRLIELLLEQGGHAFVLAADGRQALQKLAGGEYDVILMDEQMPELDGTEVTRRVREGTVPGCPPDLPIVALTAHALKGDRERFLAAGMDEYLSKPIDLDALEDVLARVAEGTIRRSR